MRVLWVVNHHMPDLAKNLGATTPLSGSWLVSISKELSKDSNIELYIACPSSDSKYKQVKIDKITYLLIPMTYFDKMFFPSKNLDSRIKKILSSVAPDIVHLQGSEFAFGIAFIKHMQESTILSIQGLISEISRNNYDMAGLKVNQVLTYVIEKVKHWRNKQRAKAEIWQLKNVKYIIGRTLWDKSHSYFANPEVKYFHLQETMRPVFFEKSWSINEIKRHSIFCAGGYNSPLKGLHNILLACSHLVNEFPNLEIKIVGNNPIKAKRVIGYPKYIIKLIDSLGLKKNVVFTGPLSAETMAEEFKRSHLYVMGSSIENSSNTLGEAISIGAPSIVPFVGGIPSIVSDEKEALFYRYEDIEQMAWQIRRVFLNDNLSIRLSEGARKRALEQYSTNRIKERMVEIYNCVIEK